MDIIADLALQIAWGADEFLADAPQDRRTAPPPPPTPIAAARTPAARLATVPVGPAFPADAARIADSCASLAELQAALAAFTGCALRETATSLVFADGPDHAELMLIGEAPGPEEDREGRPFIGPGGQLLDRMLASIGQDRATLRLTNILPWRPPGNRSPTAFEIAICLPFLHRHIALVRPKAMILLGAVAAKALLPEPDRSQALRRLRGVWRRVHIPGLPTPCPALATYHPDYLARIPAAKAESWQDLLRLRESMEAGLPPD